MDEAAAQLRSELHNVITRYCDEADLTYATIIGILEGVKFDIMSEVQQIDEEHD